MRQYGIEEHEMKNTIEKEDCVYGDAILISCWERGQAVTKVKQSQKQASRLCQNSRTLLTSIFQMSSAYSLMARSEENLPIRAVQRMDF